MFDVVTWTGVGLGVGCSSRMLFRARGNVGWAGDLVAGWLGAVVAGWIVRRTLGAGPEAATAHVLAALLGAAALAAALRVAHRMARSTAAHVAATAADPMPLSHRIGTLSERERSLWQAILSRRTVARDPNEQFDERATLGQRLADRVALFGGSWTFIGLFTIVMVCWMAINEEQRRPFDPYPFILLNLVLSCLAALQAPIIMMSQNRQAQRDRLDARADYDVNVKAEMEIMAIHAKLDLLREQEWNQLIAEVARQADALALIQKRLDPTRPSEPA